MYSDGYSQLSVFNKYLLDKCHDELVTNKRWQARCLVTLYNINTEEEQYVSQSIESDGVGFTTRHRVLYTIARHYIINNRLSDKQWKYLSETLPSYSNQIVMKLGLKKVIKLKKIGLIKNKLINRIKK